MEMLSSVVLVNASFFFFLTSEWKVTLRRTRYLEIIFIVHASFLGLPPVVFEEAESFKARRMTPDLFDDSANNLGGEGK